MLLNLPALQEIHSLALPCCMLKDKSFQASKDRSGEGKQSNQTLRQHLRQATADTRFSLACVLPLSLSSRRPSLHSKEALPPRIFHTATVASTGQNGRAPSPIPATASSTRQWLGSCPSKLQERRKVFGGEAIESEVHRLYCVRWGFVWKPTRGPCGPRTDLLKLCWKP